MRVICISDLHGYLPKLKESGELLLICGDISPLSIQFKMNDMQTWIETVFTNWLNSLDFKKILFIAGNHDIWFERNKDILYKMFPQSNKATYLCNNLYEYISEENKIYRIFGTPYCKIFGRWAFMRTNEILSEKYDKIPENLDVLITHDPPRIGTVDVILQNDYKYKGTECGNNVLLTEILIKQPKIVISGHIHSGNHTIEEINNIKFVNASLLDECYNINYEPILLNI